MRARVLGTAAVIAALAGGPSAAAPGDRTDYLAALPDMIANWVAGAAAIAARTTVELRYDRVAFDLATGTLSLRGLVLDQIPSRPGCRIEAARAEVTPTSLLTPGAARMALRLSDARAGWACLADSAQNAAMLGAMIGTPQLTLREAAVEVDYDMPSGGATLSLRVDAPDLGRLSAEAVADYVAVLSTPRGAGRPGDTAAGEDAALPAGEGLRVRLAWARASYEDAGLAKQLRRLLPGSFGPQDVAQALGADDAPAAARPLIAAAAEEVAAFLAAPDRLAVELRPDAPVTIDTREPTLDPWAILAALKPLVAEALPPRNALLPAATLRAVLADPATATAEDRRAVGIALATGIGAPRDPARALAILGDTAGDAEAALALAEALSGRDDAAAYAQAQRAAADGAAGAPAVLDAIEARVGIPSALAWQAAGAPVPADDLAGITTASELCARAADRREGAGVPRDYARAAALAALGAAAGEVACETLAAGIEARMARLADPAPWTAARDATQAAALDAWIAADLPARLTP